MSLNCVTITGADDETDSQALQELSARYPFVEWGILIGDVYKRQAEHCVHATGLAAAEGFRGADLVAILLHDAAEAYCGDMVKPLKIMMLEYAAVERRLEAAIEKAFGIDFKAHETAIKRFDRAMLKAEKIAMWPNDAQAVSYTHLDVYKRQVWPNP